MRAYFFRYKFRILYSGVINIIIKDINEFLKDYPIFEEQSLSKKPNLKQLKEDGNVGLDCRYLNFAPQCQGWMQITENGGFGSFIINWSNTSFFHTDYGDRRKQVCR